MGKYQNIKVILNCVIIFYDFILIRFSNKCKLGEYKRLFKNIKTNINKI